MSIKLIVGLGNPGAQYARNRHNIGFLVVDEIARKFGVTWTPRPNLELAELRFGTSKLWLMKPQTFVNLSGGAVAPFARFHKLLPDEILVVHDEMDLPFGRVRFRTGGSAGGNNGVKDVISKLGTDRFVRLKLGVSRPPAGWEVVNWVLSNFQPEESDLLEKIVQKGVEAALVASRDGALKAQNAFNGVDLRPKPPEAIKDAPLETARASVPDEPRG